MPEHGEIISGEITCKRCNQTFTWLYQEEKFQGSIVKLTLDNIKDEESIINYDPHKNLAMVYCRQKDIRQKECGQPNYFELNI